MSRRPSLKNSNSLLTAVFIAVLTAFFAGCGDGAKTAAPAAGVTVQSGPSAVTEATSATGGSGATGAGATDGQSAQTGGKPAPAAGDEQGARTPVAITVENGGFANKTPKRVHVPSFIAIELDVGVKDPRRYEIKILRAGAAKPTLKTVHPGYSTIELEGLRPGKTLTVALGARHVVVVADAEPGP